MANISNWLETALLRWAFTTVSPGTRPSAWHVGLGTGASDAGLTGEPSGAGYARQSVTFSESGGTITSAGAITFGPATGSWGTMSHFGVFDASTGGNLLFWGVIGEDAAPGTPAPKAISSGDSLSFGAGKLSLAVD